MRRKNSFLKKLDWIDEEKIYRPIVIILTFFIFLLILFKIINFMQFFISFLTLIYTLFIFFPFHRRTFTPISILIVGMMTFLIGVIAFLQKKVLFQDVNLVFYILAFLIFLSLSFGFLLYKKKGIKIDITLDYLSKKFGVALAYLFAVLLIPAFLFIVSGTYLLLGKNHIFFWGVVFVFGVIGTIRTIKDFIITYKK